MPTLIGLLGRGRLGQAVTAAARADDGVELAWTVGREGPAAAARVDVAVDVSTAAAVPAHLAWATRTRTPLVVGTTGWDPGLLSTDVPVPVLVAPNFSLGVAFVRRLTTVLGGYAAAAPAPTDLAVTETHHRHKVDSPSGTALALREALARGAGTRVEDVQTTSLRVGEVVGDHAVVVASTLETITLRHTAHSRDLFAAGALAAARWLAARTAPGVYTLDDLAEDHLRTLLGGPAGSGAAGPDAGGDGPGIPLGRDRSPHR